MGRVAVAPGDSSFNQTAGLRRLINVAIAAILVAVAVCAFPHAAQAQLPSIDIQNTCKAAAGVMLNLMGGSTVHNDVQICLDSEDKARQQILKDWSNFTASDRAGCVQAQVYLPSYVEWLTCFEMNRVVREARAAQGRALPGSNAVVVLPPVRSGRPVN
jgi:hypothetical protein